MRQINMMKQENSRIVLADGSSIGVRVDMNYRDLSGIIGKALLGIIQMRTLLKEKNAERGDPDAPLLPHEVEDLDSKLKEIIEARDERKKKKKTAVMKEEDSSNGSDNTDDDDDEDDDDDDDDVKVAASFASNNPTLNGDNESSDDDSDDDDDNLLYGKSMFSSKVKDEQVETKREVLGSKSKDDKEEIIELSSDEEDSDDDDDKAGSVPTKKESQSHTQFKHQEGSMKDQTSNERHINELTEEEQLQAAIKEEVEVNEDKENSGGPSRRDSGDGEEFFDAAETLDEIKDNVMRKEEESKPPAVETSSAGNVARVQIKLPNGKRIVKCFDENQLIKDVYSFVANSEEIKGKAFEFKVGFPPKNLGGRDESIKSASLDGESISVVWK